jgi:hypothetical protein
MRAAWVWRSDVQGQRSAIRVRGAASACDAMRCDVLRGEHRHALPHRSRRVAQRALAGAALGDGLGVAAGGLAGGLAA